MASLTITYLIFSIILSIYGARVCPFLGDVGYSLAFLNTLIPVLLLLPIRFLIHRKNQAGLTGTRHYDSSLYSIIWKEFLADLIIWAIAGLIISFLYLLVFKSPMLTGIKIFLGCLCFGIFGGMLSSLSSQEKIVQKMSLLRDITVPPPKKMIPVTGKMMFFVVTVLLFMGVSILFMFFMDINYLMENRGQFGDAIYMELFKEILYAFIILILLSFIILGRYSRNLNKVLNVQLKAMELIGQGNYEKFVPVVSNDEFGVIAAKTNEMVKGLREKNVCEVSFGKYVTPEVSEKILKDEISPEGELVDATILFCDLRGYTPLVERTDPKEVVEFLNDYFSEMEKAIREYRGIILQYIGDEIEAVFGSPIDEPDHPNMAVRAALDMRDRLSVLNRKREISGEDIIEHGIGIHTGRVLAGSLGSKDRLVYAMVGDTVNIASRIQELNKQYGSDILISHQIKKSLKKDIKAESLGMIPLKGKSEQIEIYKVV